MEHNPKNAPRSNTAKGRGIKGSKFLMQLCVEREDLRQELHARIGVPLHWLSPLPGERESFDEYELRHPHIRKQLGLTKQEAEALFAFWPKRQPQWDGIALSLDGRTLYLVEAKAHPTEMKSKCAAASEESRRQITAALREVMQTHYPAGDFDAWTEKYYQLANRLTFLRKLNEHPFGNITGVRLILLHFVDDTTYRPTAEEAWREHCRHVFSAMLGSPTAPEDVLVIHYPAGLIIAAHGGFDGGGISAPHRMSDMDDIT